MIRMSDMASVTPADGQPTVVSLPREIDVLNAYSIGEELASACLRGAKVVIADMTATTFCDSPGIRMLVLAWRQATAMGTELRMLVPSASLVRTMKLLGIDDLLPLYESFDEALAGPAGLQVSGPAAPA